MAKKKLGVDEVIATLRASSPALRPLRTDDAFELVLWENIAYLASDEKRGDALEHLRRTVGTAPRAILKAGKKAIAAVTARGILADTFADKLRECARIVVEDLGGRLHLDAKDAKQTLQRFPGIGEPGAERILLILGKGTSLAPDSNALRLLVRLGLVNDEGSYAKTYRAGRAVGEGLGDAKAMLEAHRLLVQHAKAVCKRKPDCERCALRTRCPSRGGFSAALGGGPR